MTAPVPTYGGPVAASELGVTLIHEHIFVRDPELEQNGLAPEWDRAAAAARAVESLTALHRLGVRTIVDLTVVGLGRDVALVAEVAERVPLRIVAATGLYAVDALPLYFRLHGPGQLVDEPEPLFDLFVRDIEEGIAGSPVRAGMIKVVSEGHRLSGAEERVMAAAAAAQRRTGVAITTHSVASQRNGSVQLAFLRREGVDPARIVIGHAGDSADLGYLREIMDAGSTVGFDRFGMEHMQRDETRIETAVALVRLGYADRMILSHDAAIYSHVTPPTWRASHAPDWHMEHLLRTVVPNLLARGVSQADVDQMLIGNPADLLAPQKGGPS